MTPGQLIRTQKKAIARLSLAVVVLMTTTIIAFAAFIFERAEKYELRRDVDTAIQAAIDQGLEFDKVTKRLIRGRKPVTK